MKFYLILYGREKYIKIGGSGVYQKKWTKSGNLTVYNLLGYKGKIMSFQNFQQIYQFRPNDLHYYRIAHSLDEQLNTINIDVTERKIQVIHFNISIFFASKKSSKDMYKVLNKKYITFMQRKNGRNVLI